MPASIEYLTSFLVAANSATAPGVLEESFIVIIIIIIIIVVSLCLCSGYIVVRLMIAETEIHSSSSAYGRDKHT